ncbi:MAG: MBL fold metallo-hydrolase [Sandaracinus sp.]
MAAPRRRSRALRVVGIVLVSLVLLVAGLGYSTFGGLAAIEDGEHVGATVEIVQDGYVSAAIVDLGEGHVALVDCGNDPAAASILRALARHHLGPDDVSTILLTHGHRDHVAGCAQFRHADVYALAADVAQAEGHEGPRGPIGWVASASPTGLTVDHPLEDGATVRRENAEIEVFAVPGHTAGSAAYLVDGVLFVGDSASLTSEGTLVAAPWIFTEDQAQNVASMHALADRLEHEHALVTAIVTAHSGVVTEGDPLALLRGM